MMIESARMPPAPRPGRRARPPSPACSARPPRPGSRRRTTIAAMKGRAAEAVETLPKTGITTVEPACRSRTARDRGGRRRGRRSRWASRSRRWSRRAPPGGRPAGRRGRPARAGGAPHGQTIGQRERGSATPVRARSRSPTAWTARRAPLVHERLAVGVHDDAAVHDHRVHAAAVGVVDEVVDRVEERLPLRPLGVEEHEVRPLAGLDRPELVPQSERPRAQSVASSSAVSAGICRGPGGRPCTGWPPCSSPGRGRGGSSCWGSRCRARRAPPQEELRHPPVRGHARPALAAMTGHIATAVSVRARQSISASSRPRPWDRSTFGPRTPSDSRYAVGVSPWRARPPAAPRAAHVMEREPVPRSSATRFTPAGARRCTSRPRTASPRRGSGPPAARATCRGTRPSGRSPPRLVARQGERRVAVRHALAEDDADAGVLVGLETRVRKLGAARIHEAHRAVLEELHQAEEGREVLLLLGHRHLELEDLGQGLEVVREDPADGVGVAHVQVAVDEAGVTRRWRASITRSARASASSAALPTGSRAGLDEDRAVPDDPPRAVQGDDVARAVDLERLALHA